MRLKELRKEKEITQLEIAQFLNVAPSTYRGYESETSEPTIETLKKLANYYNVTVDYLIENNVNNNIGYLDDDTKEIVKCVKLLNKDQKNKVMGYVVGMLEDSNIIKDYLNKSKNV